MITILIIMMSLSTIYFTRLLTMKKMRTAAISVAVLYSYLIIWLYSVFIIDIADLGFSEYETRISLLHGSDIYHSFVRLTTKMAVIPLPILKAIVGVAAMIFVAACFVAFHGIFEITKAVIVAVKTKKLFSSLRGERDEFKNFLKPLCEKHIIRMHCRMNC